MTAYQENLWERAWRWCKRHQRLLSRSAAAVLVLGLVAFGLWQVREMQEAWRIEREDAELKLQQSETAKRRAEEEAAGLQRVKQARADVDQFRRLAEEARFYAANTDQVDEHAPFYDAKIGEHKSQEALAIASGWGPDVQQLPLAEEREPLKKDLYDLRLLLAHMKTQQATPKAADEALALLEAAALLQQPSRAFYRVRVRSNQVRGDKQKADADARLADAPDTPATALDHFLRGEQFWKEAERPVDGSPERKFFQPEREHLVKAVEQYRLALRSDPNHYWSHFQLGRCYMALRQNAEAVESLGTCVALRPGSPWGYSSRGLALAQLGRYDEAIADLDRALVLDADFRPARLQRGVVFALQKQYDKALADFDAVLGPPQDRRLIEAAFYRGQVHMERKELDKALADFDRVTAETARIRSVYLLRAKIHFVRGDNARGLDDLNGYLAHGRPFDPRSAEAHERRGRQLRLLAGELQMPKDRKRQLLQTALGELQKSAELGGKSAALFDDLGGVLEMLGRGKDALEAYSQALELDPKDVRVLVKHGWACEQLQPPDLEAALKDFAAALRIDPERAEAHTGLGYIQAALKKQVDAQRQANLAVLNGAGDYLILHNVACIYAKLSESGGKRAGEYEDLAIDHLRQAVHLWKKGRTGPDERRLIAVEPAFTASLRARPEFQQLLKADRP